MRCWGNGLNSSGKGRCRAAQTAAPLDPYSQLIRRSGIQKSPAVEFFHKSYTQ
jgi:hypothetical protein